MAQPKTAAGIMAAQKFMVLTPVAGTTFNMLPKGDIRVYINPTNAERFKQELLRFCGEIDRYLIACVEAAKQAEVSAYVLPQSRIEQLEAELARLKGAAELTTSAQVIPLHLQPPTPSVPPPVFDNDQTRASALVSATPVIIPPAIPGFDEAAARSHTIVSGGFEGGDDGTLPRPTGPTL